MQNKFQDYLNSILAGAIIGLGCMVYLSTPDHVVGAFLFSFGLITIMANKYYLYTGMIGEYTPRDTLKYLIILLCNIFGAFVIGGVAEAAGYSTSYLIGVKLLKSNFKLFLDSIFCGILMQIGVTTAKRKNNPLYAIMAVMIFILIGAEHCIANAFYFTIGSFSLDYVPFFIINILGNSIGAIIWYRLEKTLDNNN